jgi:nucleotide-binding universal stress UspA family protein
MDRTEMAAKGCQVLLATDGSDPATIGVDLVANLTWRDDTVVTILEAVEIGAGLIAGPEPFLVAGMGDLEDQIIAEAHGRVQAAGDRISGSGVGVRTLVRLGRPADVIVDAAKEMDADLVVVGSRGHGTIESMLLGSVSAEVVARSEVPVLVARRDKVERIILAWDTSPGAERSANLLTDWPTFAHAEVRVVSIAETWAPWWAGIPESDGPAALMAYGEAIGATRREHEGWAQSMADRLRAHGVAASGIVREGDPAAQIIAAARSFDADLIVMGTRGRTGLQRLLLGSAARNVVLHAPSSVLVAHPSPRPS